jgi:hypothetical protein
MCANTRFFNFSCKIYQPPGAPPQPPCFERPPLGRQSRTGGVNKYLKGTFRFFEKQNVLSKEAAGQQ